MFGEFHGLPVHILVVHAAVVLVPLAAFLAVLFVVPKTHAWSRVPLVLVSVAALIVVFVARQSGIHLDQNLASRSSSFASGTLGALIATHQSRGKQLFLMMIAFTVIVLVAYWLSRNPETYKGPVAYITSAVLLIGAVVIGVQVARVGEIGSKAVWNPTGDFDYGNT